MVKAPNEVKELRPEVRCACCCDLEGLPATLRERRQQIEIPPNHGSCTPSFAACRSRAVVPAAIRATPLHQQPRRPDGPPHQGETEAHRLPGVIWAPAPSASSAPFGTTSKLRAQTPSKSCVGYDNRA